MGISVKHRIEGYCDGVLSREIVAGPSVRGAAKRHLGWFKRASCHWEESRAALAVSCFEEGFKHSTGAHAGKPFKLFPWEVFLVGSIFGWIGDDGFRVIRKVYCETGKGSGKTPLAAGLCIIMTACDGEPRAETYLIARTGDQAKIPMTEVIALIASSPAFSPLFRVVGGANATRVYYRREGFPGGRDPYLSTLSRIERLSTDSLGEGKSGFKTHMLGTDEYHEHSTSATHDMLAFGFKDRGQPLDFIITNAGGDFSSPCGQEHLVAMKVAAQKVEYPSYLSFVCDLDSGDDPWNDEGCWPKVNPSLPVLPGYSYLRKQVEEAQVNESKRASIGRLNFCVWGHGATSWIHVDRWPWGKVADEKLRDLPCFLSLDLAQKNDLAGGAAVWDRGEDGFHARTTAWMPGKGLDRRSEKEGIPWVKWRDQGWIYACDSEMIEFKEVAEWVKYMMDHFLVLGLCYDPWKIEDLRKELQLQKIAVTDLPADEPDALWLEKHSQSFNRPRADERTLWMPGSIEVVEGFIKRDLFTVEDSPVLRYGINGVGIVEDEFRNRRFTKGKSAAKIDPLVALTMGCGFANRGLTGLDAHTMRKARERMLRDYWSSEDEETPCGFMIDL